MAMLCCNKTYSLWNRKLISLASLQVQKINFPGSLGMWQADEQGFFPKVVIISNIIIK